MIINGMTLIEVLPLRDLYTVHQDHHRLTVFANKGRKCVVCDREGVLLLVRQNIKDGALHVDLYTEDFVLMTVDHIVPKYICKQMGWSKEQIEDLLNKQPMCDPCNNKKGSKDITVEEQRRRLTSKPQRRTGGEIIRQLVGNNNLFDRSLV